ncbi:MAG: GNAT family N-acetyltransferase [Dokdonella sp.]|nr:GNAT family N-acetyltransferase [Dokdonella sp.]MCB1571135.1 GNAT family N-acetyltransferase [Xanthomonadales bacterium]
MPPEIRIDDLSAPAVHALLRDHLQNMALHSPPESIHALDLEALRHPCITFWTAWDGQELLGCGALKELDATHAEIKSMRTATAHRRKGIAAAMLEHLLTVAGQRGYRRLSLETGSMAAFEPARAMYARFGFVPCGPFDGYVEDPYSVFMTKSL